MKFEKTEFVFDYINVMLGALNFSIIQFLYFKYNGTFTHSVQCFNLNAQTGQC